MPNLPFEYHPEAIAEAHAAFNWYAERSPQAADRFWRELVRARNMNFKTELFALQFVTFIVVPATGRIG